MFGGLEKDAIKKYLIFFVGVVCLWGGATLLLSSRSPSHPAPAKQEVSLHPAAEDDIDAEGEDEDRPIVVYVSGAVRRAGVYELGRGSRINDAVAAAGGLTSFADIMMINFAEPLVDGSRLHIPIKANRPPKPGTQVQTAASNDVPPPGQSTTYMASSSTSSKSKKININTCTAEELMKLHGIGEKYSQHIIAYRNAHGPFKEISDIKKVRGIGDGIFKNIKDHITVGR